jgi:methylated-DNA-[protein]-cysteine S-methyltransferase
MTEPTAFAMRVYARLKKVPAGKVTTYADLARAVGCGSSQAVGQVLKKNPFAPEVPCHRVVKSDGTLGGFMGKTKGESIEKKIALLRKEGVVVEENSIQDFEKKRHRF